jgi:ferrochelatase
MDVPVGSTVGVVLLGPGGPQTHAEVPAFLYRQYMDPAVAEVRFGLWIQHVVSRVAAKRRAAMARREYEAIGGRAPMLRHVGELAVMLQRDLERTGAPRSVGFRVYLAMRYGDPSPQGAIRRMRADGIRHVVLLPLHPQFSEATTGSSLAFWQAALEREGADFRTVAVRAYPDDPDFVQAISERIDEALQRFPRAVRRDVKVVFVAHGYAPRGRKDRCAPYCCHVHRTVDAVMRLRGQDRPFEVAYQAQPGLPVRLTPLLVDAVHRMGDQGQRAVLVVPVSFVTEQVDTAYRLEVTVRREAESCGIAHYEVAMPLNCHPLIIRALADVTAERIATAGVPLLERERPAADGHCPRGRWTGPSAAGAGFDERCSRCEFAEGEIGRS